jgi:hypothetical protein
MGGKSRKTGHVSKALIDQLAKRKREQMTPEERAYRGKMPHFRDGLYSAKYQEELWLKNREILGIMKRKRMEEERRIQEEYERSLKGK